MSGKSGFGKNVKIFGVNNSSSGHTDNRMKDILILGKQGLDDTTLLQKLKEYSINFN